jgi:hypothetical protein
MGDPMTQAIVPGSLAAISGKANMSLAESFLNVDALIVVDTSASMHTKDAAGGEERYFAACRELERLQATLPGKIGVISFSDYAKFCPGGVPEFISTSTNLVGALKFIQTADNLGIKFVVISDGEPDDEQAALDLARKFKTKLDVVYIGREGGGGRLFLGRLAEASGGKYMAADLAKDLNQKVQLLLA